MKKIGIYCIRNTVNGKMYIGQTRNYGRRVIQHRYRLSVTDNQSYKAYSKLYPAVQKYGIGAFSFELIEECCADHLNDREIYWIRHFDTYKNGYNATIGGGNPIAYWTGKKRSAETIAKVSASLRGKVHSEETRRKRSAALAGKTFPGKGRFRAIRCIETGEEYKSVKQACLAIGCSQSLMHKHLKGIRATAKGYTFEYGVETIPQGSRQE